MKYQKRYNVFLVLVLVIMVTSITCYCSLDFDHVESQEDKSVLEIIEEEHTQEVVESSTIKKLKFNTFNTAYKYATNYLKSAKGYKTYFSGAFNLNVKNLVDISQFVKGYSTVNNKNNSYESIVSTSGAGKIKANLAYQYIKIGDEVSWREGDIIDSGFNFENKDVTRVSSLDFVNEWGMHGNDVFFYINPNEVGDGTLSKNGADYILNFTVENCSLVKGSTKFVKRMFRNSENSKHINPVFDALNITMSLDAYGRPKTIQYSITYHDLDLTGCGIPLSGLNGSVSYTEQFYGMNQEFTINAMPDKVE